MIITDAPAVEPPLAPNHLLRLLVVRNWLAIGIIEEARCEFNALPQHAKMHPEADEIRAQLFARG